MMTATECELPQGDTSTALDLAELARAWHRTHVITLDGGTWRADPRDGGETVTAGSAAGLWLALWDARDAS